MTRRGRKPVPVHRRPCVVTGCTRLARHGRILCAWCEYGGAPPQHIPSWAWLKRLADYANHANTFAAGRQIEAARAALRRADRCARGAIYALAKEPPPPWPRNP